jgi:NADPH-dependent 2,4-dienoyl-CoA reductase/sulfur reductase-like enzyme
MREYDVLVAGRGERRLRGALAAARTGARVLLAERYGSLGGTATASMVGPWMTSTRATTESSGRIAQEMVDR